MSNVQNEPFRDLKCKIFRQKIRSPNCTQNGETNPWGETSAPLASLQGLPKPIENENDVVHGEIKLIQPYIDANKNTNLTVLHEYSQKNHMFLPW